MDLNLIQYLNFSFKTVLPGIFLSGAFYYEIPLLAVGFIAFTDLWLYMGRGKIFFDLRLQEIYKIGYKKHTKWWFHSNFSLSILSGAVFSLLYWENLIEPYWFMVHFIFFTIYSIISGSIYYFYINNIWKKLKNKQEVFNSEDKQIMK